MEENDDDELDVPSGLMQVSTEVFTWPVFSLELGEKF